MLCTITNITHNQKELLHLQYLQNFTNVELKKVIKKQVLRSDEKPVVHVKLSLEPYDT